MSITWNGVNSDTIGVIVERIPNRYVPTRRFSPQQVAGRNGNILLVDKSFPNVEQEYEVYLSAEAQGLPSVARACAEWLMGPDGYCRLEDSYDTTVYREAFLMGGYDLENILNKFGRCTITFSCKPQKYLLTGDTPIEIPAGTTTTYTGSTVQFDGITGASITSLSTTITPIQDLHGYAKPWPAGGGKNILPLTEWFQAGYTTTTGGVTMTVNADGSITLSGTPSAQADFYLSRTISGVTQNPFYVSAGTYTVSMTGTATNSGVKLVMSGSGQNGYPYSEASSNGTAKTGTVADATQPFNYLLLRVTSGTVSNGTYYIQFESGSPATSWTPYENICPISAITGLSVYVSPTQDPDDATVYNVEWSTQAGTVYGGTVDVVTGVLTVDKVCVNLGDYDWTYDSTYTRFQHTFTNIKNQSARTLPMQCSALEPIYDGRAIGSVPDNAVYSGNSVVNIKYSAAGGNTTSFKTAMNGVQLCYPLGSPYTYQLTPQEIQALVGTNNVWSSSGDVSVTVTTPLGGIVTNPTPFEARPMLEVSGVGEITINGKSIQILESVSDFEIDCETMEAEDNSKIYCMDFPELSGGENEIVGDGSITSLTVVPRWWTL